MKKENKKALGVMLFFLVAAFIFFLKPMLKTDVGLCRDIFWGFVEGRQSLQGYIDWEHLNALGSNVGSDYSKLPNAQEKEEYRMAFYKNFSRSFKRKGGTFELFNNWRIYEQNGATTIVAVDYPAKHKVALFTLSGFNKKKLTNIKWEGDK